MSSLTQLSIRVKYNERLRQQTSKIVFQKIHGKQSLLFQDDLWWFGTFACKWKENELKSTL